MLPWLPRLCAIWPCLLPLPYCKSLLAHYTLMLLISLVKVISASFLFLRHVRSFQLLGFVVIALTKKLFPQLFFWVLFFFFIMADPFLSFRTFHESFPLRKIISRLPYLSASSSPSHTPMLFCLVPAITYPNLKVSCLFIALFLKLDCKQFFCKF